jgi:hypothetical protein
MLGKGNVAGTEGDAYRLWSKQMGAGENGDFQQDTAQSVYMLSLAQDHFLLPMEESDGI